MSKRLYLGRLPADARSEDVSKFFEGYGRIIDCRVMTGGSGDRREPPGSPSLNKPSSGFGFVEFESAKDAEDAVTNFNGKPFMGQNIVVEFAKESRPRRDPYEGDRGGHGAPRSRRPPGIRLLVSGVSRDTSWQDLKDFGRDAGSVSFADIDRDVPGQGILEYLSRDDADRAVKELDGKDLRGRPVRVALDDARAGPDNYRRDDRRDDRRGGDDRYDDRRYRDERPSYRPRERSRSPGDRRRDYSRRSPPRESRGYEDYHRRGGYEDRQPNSYDRYREEPDSRRRGDDERSRPERDDRRPREKEDRPPRDAGRSEGGRGDSGWGR